MAEKLILTKRLNSTKNILINLIIIISILINKTNSIIFPFEYEPVCFSHEILEDNLKFEGNVSIVNFTGMCNFSIESEIESETNKKYLVYHLFMNTDSEKQFNYSFESNKNLIRICFVKMNNNHENSLIHFTMQDPFHPEKSASKEKLEDYNSEFKKVTKHVVKMGFDYVNEKFKRDEKSKMFNEISNKITNLTVVKIVLIIGLVIIQLLMIINIFSNSTNKIVRK